MSLCAHACHGEQMSRAPLSLGRIPGVAESWDARRFKMVDGGLRDLTMQAWMSAIWSEMVLTLFSVCAAASAADALGGRVCLAVVRGAGLRPGGSQRGEVPGGCGLLALPSSRRGTPSTHLVSTLLYTLRLKRTRTHEYSGVLGMSLWPSACHCQLLLLPSSHMSAADQLLQTNAAAGQCLHL